MIRTILFVLLLLPAVVQAQSTVVEVNVAEEDTVDRFGPNRAVFFHHYFQLGFVASQPEGDSLQINYGTSFEWSTGFRYKRRVSNFYALGFDFSYRNARYYIHQDSSKNFPSTNLHKREWFVQHSLDGEFYNRFNFGKRGDIIGTYIDLGAYSSWGFSMRHKARDVLAAPRPDGAKSTLTVGNQLNWANPYNYGVCARIGSNQVALFGRYRMSDIVDRNGLAELPRLIVGIEIGTFGQ